MTNNLEKELGDKFPWEKTVKELFSKDILLEDIGYLVNELTSVGLQLGGIGYAISGSDPGHIRDGILIFVGGKLMGYGYKGLKYLQKIKK